MGESFAGILWNIKDACHVFGSIDDRKLEEQKSLVESEVYKSCVLDISNDWRSVSRASALGIIATCEAFKQVKWKANSGYRAGVCFGVGLDGPNEVMNTSSGILSKKYSTIGPHALTRILGNMPAGIISRIWGLRGPCMTVNTACASGLHCIGEGFRMIQNNEADLVVTGACESPLNAWIIAAFCRLRALCTQFNDTPEKASRPFDSLRKGFVLSEGAATVVLQAWPPPDSFLVESFIETPKPIAEVIGFGRSGDAHHLVAPDATGNGALRSMLNAFKDSKLEHFSQIGHINCHATSTPVGDLTELSAIAQIFGEYFTPQYHTPVVINSIKGHLGHCLAAAGAIETVYSALSVNQNRICGNLNLHNPISIYELMEVLKSNSSSSTNISFNEKCIDLFKNYAVLPRHDEIQVAWPDSHRRIVMTNSFGFGGTNGTLLISEWTD
ncbi:unnamed protein product [Schistosoma rodhaini]|uniref:beta-ketoacyl-[acyl-carrier-protein] synthase I n=1 Tax=Schistosoma rodhaini TaxID=6188 RepID=A0AA85G2J0_9TREM|nr:unnamed protein product [Schistosoma rodhaini]CAH8601453.1 unnamed protein product [Schistosoma rodhaini]